MNGLIRSSLACGATVCALALAAAIPVRAADPIPYPNSGSYNPITYSFTAASTGNVTAYIVGGFGAGYTNEMGLLVNGVLSGSGFGLNNKTTSVGDSFDLGPVTAGDSLVFVLKNYSLADFAYSDPNLNVAYDGPNSPGHNHIYSTAYTATSPVFGSVPAGTYVAFEDLRFPDSDYNYDDESFVFTNVGTTVVPEPGTLGLLAGALLPALTTVVRRRR